jgi:hypothetical protein
MTKKNQSKKHFQSSSLPPNKQGESGNQTEKKNPVPSLSLSNYSQNMTATIQSVQPEQLSLDAYDHIQKCLATMKKNTLEQEDLNAVLRLSQHLRVFGLLSAIGYVNQSNDQEGKVRQRTVPIWKCLIEQLFQPEQLKTLLKLTAIPESFTAKQLMEAMQTIARDEPQNYMSMWRKSLMIANYWNFWARAYSHSV